MPKNVVDDGETVN